MGFRAINKTVVIKPIRVVHDQKGFEVNQSLSVVRFHYGKVLASSQNNVVKTNDFVYYDGAAGSPLLHDGEEYMVMDEKDIKLIEDG